MELTVGLASLLLLLLGGALAVFDAGSGHNPHARVPSKARSAPIAMELAARALSPKKRQVVAPRRCSIHASLRRAWARMTPYSVERAVELVLADADEMRGQGWAENCELLDDVLREQLRQAVDATPAGWTLTLSLARSGDEAVVSIASHPEREVEGQHSGGISPDAEMGNDELRAGSSGNPDLDPCLGSSDAMPYHAINSL